MDVDRLYSVLESTADATLNATMTMAPLQLLLLAALLWLAPSLRRPIRPSPLASSVRLLHSLSTYEVEVETDSLPISNRQQRASFVEEKLDKLDNAMIKLVMSCATAQQRYLSKLSGSSSNSNSNSGNMGTSDLSTESWDGVYNVMAGLDAWAEALSKGCLPYSDIIMDYDRDDEEGGKLSIGANYNNDYTATTTFPAGDLCRQLCRTCQQMDLPRLTGAHPEIVPAVLRALLQIAGGYYADMRRRIERREEAAREVAAEREQQIDWETFEHPPEEEEGGGETDIILVEEDGVTGEERRDIISTAVRRFELTWGPAVGSVNLLDTLFGTKHRLLNPFATDKSTADDLHSYRHEQRGYSLFDGVWSNSGWKVMQDLQVQINQMEVLQEFLAGLGRRSVVTGRVLRKMPQQREAPRSAAPKSVSSSRLVPTSLTDVKQSSDIEGLLPKELCLLLNSSLGESSNRRRRLLFSAKLLQNQLFSYEKSGFHEQYSLPDRSKPHLRRLPTDKGGPVILCLDTSYSMTGFRETLAKAVVLQSSIVASRDGRECYIIAFSASGKSKSPSSKGIAECLVPLKLDDSGLTRLLSFLSNSFKGGTDVTEPLLKAIELMESNPAFGNADIVLVTDGELPNPPIAPPLMNRLRQMELQCGLEVHGLLIGRNSSLPLQALCTSYDGKDRVHDFLCRLDPILNMFALKQQSLLQQEEGEEVEVPVAAATDSDLESFYATSSLKRSMRLSCRGGSTHTHTRRGRSRLSTRMHMCSPTSAQPGALTLESQLQWARTEVSQLVDARYKSMLQEYVDRGAGNDDAYASLQGVLAELSSGLIERELEAQLLLLAVLSKEHLLLFGAPGTGKSELGRRLARLAAPGVSGGYFERLLTKFTQPEELFGPLSLRALEEDKYVRATGGYLPSAQVVFLDEIFKSSSSILNSLLTILNERKFSNGAVLEAVPLLTCIGASNEFPDSEELDALFDRFLLRRCVNSVTDERISELIALASRPPAPSSGALLSHEVLHSVREGAKSVAVPAEVVELLKKLRIYLRDECDTYVSDRRLLKAVGALQIAAAANGRKAVSLLDCLLLQHILWSKPDDRARIEEFVWNNMVTDNRSIKFILTSILQSLKSDASLDGRQAGISSLGPLVDVLAKKMASLRTLRAEIRCDVSAETGDFRRHLFLGDADVALLKQRIAPRVGSALRDLQASLETAVAVRQCTAAAGTATGAADAAKEEEAFKGRLEELLLVCGASAEQGGSRGDSEEEGEGEGEAFLDSASGLTALELALSSKEAKRKLSAEAFRAWKRAQKAKIGGLEKRGARIYNSNSVNDEVDD